VAVAGMHIVIVPDPFTSKLLTSLALADRLRAIGHRVTMRIPPGPLDHDRLGQLGIGVDLEDLRIDPPQRPGPTPAAIERAERQLADEGADLYLIDTEAHEYVLVALAVGLPVGLLSVLFNLWKRPGVPPVHQDVVPGRGLRGTRLGIEYGWAGYRVRRSLQIARSMVKRDDRRHHLLAMASRLGLEPRSLLTELHGLIPFQYRTLPTLALNLAELELPGAVHPSHHYVGPMINLAGAGFDKAEADTTLARIDAFRQRWPDRALVYAAFGAYYGGDDREFWRRAVAAIGGRDDWIGVLGLGGRIDRAELGPVPDNVLALPWAPQLPVLARADVAMIHAGMTSVYECLLHRVPMVVFPLGDSFDQYGTAARVDYHGLGPIGDRRTATAADIEALIDRTLANRALAETGVGERLEQFGQAIDRVGHDDTLASAIESIDVIVSRRSSG